MRWVEALARASAALAVALAAVALLVSLALIGYSVAMRYFLNDPVPWVDEMVGYLLVVAVMLAAADALRRGDHICVDLLTDRLTARRRRFVALLGLVAVAITAAVLLVEGWSTVAFSRMTGLVSNGHLATPLWIPQLALPVGAAVLLLAALSGIAQAIGRRSRPDGDTGAADGGGSDAGGGRGRGTR